MNPHDCNNHKILSLARLPVPTLPHIFDFLSLVSRDFDIISNQTKYVNTYFYFSIFLKCQAINAKLLLQNIISSLCTILSIRFCRFLLISCIVPPISALWSFFIMLSVPVLCQTASVLFPIRIVISGSCLSSFPPL